jgi:hypothetical protein
MGSRGQGIVGALLIVAGVGAMLAGLWLTRLRQQEQVVRLATRDVALAQLNSQLHGLLQDPTYVREQLLKPNAAIANLLGSKEKIDLKDLPLQLNRPDGTPWLGQKRRVHFPSLLPCPANNCPLETEVLARVEALDGVGRIDLVVRFATLNASLTGPFNSEKHLVDAVLDLETVPLKLEGDKLRCEEGFHAVSVRYPLLRLWCRKNS